MYIFFMFSYEFFFFFFLSHAIETKNYSRFVNRMNEEKYNEATAKRQKERERKRELKMRWRVKIMEKFSLRKNNFRTSVKKIYIYRIHVFLTFLPSMPFLILVLEVAV